MEMNRRDLIKLLLSSAIAETIDVEKLLWTPKPIITVPSYNLNKWLFDPDANIGQRCDINRIYGGSRGSGKTNLFYKEIVNIINRMEEMKVK